MFILNESIKDHMLIDILYKLFNAPVRGVEKGGPNTSKEVEVLQGNPLSSLLVNIYLMS